MPEENTNLIVKRSDDSYMLIKRITVHVDYVNEDGTPRTDDEGRIDNGNYALEINGALLPKETIQGLAQFYDAALAEQEGGE